MHEKYGQIEIPRHCPIILDVDADSKSDTCISEF